jgi:3-dehydroquinate synthase
VSARYSAFMGRNWSPKRAPVLALWYTNPSASALPPMHVHQQRFTVSFEYPVYFCNDAFAGPRSVLGQAIARLEPDRRHRVAIVIEARVAELWPDVSGELRACLEGEGMEVMSPAKVLPGGEGCKNDPDLPDRLIEYFDGLGLDRHSVVVVLGGGAFQDLVGYAGATFHRGLRVVRMPTTVLSQNDAGIGVKNGINALNKKNLLGTFSPPFAVIDDFRFLKTLDERDRRAGLAEAVKVALLEDAAFFGWLVREAHSLARFDAPTVEESIRRCAELHLGHIARSGDPFEAGSSRPLDFGHWAAHKLEVLSGYELRHGEAVAIGLCLDTRYSVEIGLLPSSVADAVARLLTELGLPIWSELLELRAPDGHRLIFEGLQEFREHLGGDLTLMMLADIGEAVEVHEVDTEAMERAMSRMMAGRSRVTPSELVGAERSAVRG